jgi:predicted SnoaL-like aldol condensation-catalyzing enzyme
MPKPKPPEIRYIIHNPNTPEDSEKLAIEYFAEMALNIRRDPKNAGKSFAEIFREMDEAVVSASA